MTADQTSRLWCVLRASSHNALTAHTADLAEARRLAADWQDRAMGPAVVLPEAELLAAQARKEAQEALLWLLYRHLPFTAVQPGGIPGTCYLLCFDRPYRHARHYLGWSGEVDAREAAHEAGRGARLTAVIAAAGIGWQVSRTWPGTDRYFERMLKRRRRSTRLCPLCNPGNHRAIPLAADGAASPSGTTRPKVIGAAPSAPVFSLIGMT